MESDLTIRDVMAREYVGVSESDTVQGAVELMRDERVGSVVVLRGTEPVGMMTEWDVLELVAEEEDPTETPVEAVMSAPVVSMDADRRLGDAVEAMSRHDIRRMVANSDDEVVGVLTERDVIAASASLSSLPVRGERPGETESVRAGVDDTGVTAFADDATVAEFAGQSICEACGSLTRDLVSVNGQLMCGNCREM